MSTDEEVEQLLRRTRAARERVNSRMAAIGEATHSIRSPLKERSNLTRTTSPSKLLGTRSPVKAVASPLRSPSKPASSPLKSTSSPTKSAPSAARQRSPIRTTVTTHVYKPSSAEKGVDEFNERSEETYNREVTERKTTILGEPVVSGNRETYSKTTITEKEETIQKTEVLKFTEVGSSASGLDPLKLLEERRNRRRQEAAAAAADGGATLHPHSSSKTVKFSDKPKTHEISLVDSPKPDDDAAESSGRRMGSPSRFASCRDDVSSPDKSSNAWTPNKATINYKFNTKNEEAKMEEEEEDDGDDEEGSNASGRRRRLKALASKFRVYDEDEEEIVQAKLVADAAATSSPSKRDLTKIVDVDRDIPTSPRRGRSPTKRLPDPDLVKSLKAQGFQETGSKSKLVYDFSPKERPSSPFKPNPHQFICPQKSSGTSSGGGGSPMCSTGGGYRSVSPTRMLDPAKPSGSYSPHPLQFVSPQRSKSPSKPPPPSQDPPPPKPLRSFEDAEKTDTASRRSMSEKRKMFEDSPTKSESPDPAMLPLSQRKALFEKNPTAPKPVARFGQSVTPAMLKALETPEAGKKVPAAVPATEPTWKRKREVSPQRSFTPESSTRRFESSRKLFENVRGVVEATQGSNDIARSMEESKRKDMEMLLNRFAATRNAREEKGNGEESTNKYDEERASASGEESLMERDEDMMERDEARRTSYPGVDSLKRIKVSPPRPGHIYPDLHDIYDERPETSMSGETAVSESPSLGTSIKRAAVSHSKMPEISEGSSREEGDDDDDDVGMENERINDMLDEALDVSTDESGPTPPKARRLTSTSPSASSTTSWEFQTTSHDFKTPRVDDVRTSPSKASLPVVVETEDGEATPASELFHTVSFYRKQKPTVQFSLTPHEKIVGNALPSKVAGEEDEEEEDEEELIARRIRKLEEEVEEQMQRRMQSSKALEVCASKNEFEGSYERVEFERLLLEAHHKHAAASAEIRRLKTEGARRMSMGGGREGRRQGKKGGGVTRGSVSVSGISLPLKHEFVRMVNGGGDDSVHYFLCLVKYRAQVIATQMLSTVDGISSHGNLVFSNLINVNDLDFDFQIYLEVYGLQTPREHLTHEVKYHIRKDKSMFNLTPLRRLKKQAESRPTARENPVNSMTIRKSKFGLVGYTTITIDTLADKAFGLQKVPARSPLQGGMAMKLSVHSECQVEERGFLTMFVDVNGFGNWCRRWCLLQDNTLYFWKYPEDEGKKAPSEQVSLHNCITETPVTLAPREICSRINTLMLETRRPMQPDDKPALDMTVNRQKGVTTIRHLLMADTRDDRINWCNVLTKSLECMRAWDPTSCRPRASSTTSSSTMATTTTDGSDTASAASTDIW